MSIYQKQEHKVQREPPGSIKVGKGDFFFVEAKIILADDSL